MSSSTRWTVFVHDPDGDMGEAVTVGSFVDQDVAWARADAITRASDRRGLNLEAFVVVHQPGRTALQQIIDTVTRFDR
jgi:hypothetical protein